MIDFENLFIVKVILSQEVSDDVKRLNILQNGTADI